jgi:hypothetical protein
VRPSARPRWRRRSVAGNPCTPRRCSTPAMQATAFEHISALMDSTDPDLSRFAARGGKLILKENMSDHAISPFNGVAYYMSVVHKLGQASVDSFMRFYVTPGANHGGAGLSAIDGTALPQGVDLLDAVDAWVDRGVAPGALIQVAQEFETTICRHGVATHVPLSRLAALYGRPAKGRGEFCLRRGKRLAAHSLSPPAPKLGSCL